MDFSVLERAILDYADEYFESEELSLQLQSAEIIKRDYTGVGFFVYIKTDPSISPLPSSLFPESPFNGPEITSPLLTAGAMSLFYFDGSRRIDCIEICSYADEFPERLSKFELRDVI